MDGNDFEARLRKRTMQESSSQPAKTPKQTICQSSALLLGKHSANSLKYKSGQPFTPLPPEQPSTNLADKWGPFNPKSNEVPSKQQVNPLLSKLMTSTTIPAPFRFFQAKSAPPQLFSSKNQAAQPAQPPSEGSALGPKASLRHSQFGSVEEAAQWSAHVEKFYTDHRSIAHEMSSQSKEGTITTVNLSTKTREKDPIMSLRGEKRVPTKISISTSNNITSKTTTNNGAHNDIPDMELSSADEHEDQAAHEDEDQAAYEDDDHAAHEDEEQAAHEDQAEKRVARTRKCRRNIVTGWPEHVKYVDKDEVLVISKGKFIMPDGELYDHHVLMRVGKSWKAYRLTLKKMYFDVANKSIDHIYDSVPDGISPNNW